MTKTMASQKLLRPQVNYDSRLISGENVFRERFSLLSDEEWCSILTRSVSESSIWGVEFPSFPETELQNRIHGHSSGVSMEEAAKFFHFVKRNTYKGEDLAKEMTILDFGSGWGRMVRPFMRDFELRNLFGFEPNYLFCVIARALNPYCCFLHGDYSPDGTLPLARFDLVVGWSVFSHLSERSASQWLQEMARIVRPGGQCVFTTWGERFLQRLIVEEKALREGRTAHWYSQVCIEAAGSLTERLRSYQDGEFVWFTRGESELYGEAFVGQKQVQALIDRQNLPFELTLFDTSSLPQDAFIIRRL